jgi:hypothetical protein
MLKATIYIQRNMSSRSDDTVYIYDTPNCSEVYRVVYKTPESVLATQVYMGRSAVFSYVSDLLKSLTHDVVPFEHVQVNTCIHPSVVYHVSDLDSKDVRRLIENMIYDAAKTKMTRIEK